MRALTCAGARALILYVPLYVYPLWPTPSASGTETMRLRSLAVALALALSRV